MSDLRNDILVQMHETLVEQSKTLGRLEGKLDGHVSRIESLEKTNTRQWWLHSVTPALVALYGVARKLGVGF